MLRASEWIIAAYFTYTALASLAFPIRPDVRLTIFTVNATVIATMTFLAIAAQRAPGEVIEVELEDAGGGRLKYDLKILAKNGRVRELELDAKTGATLKLEDD